jgi:proline dehydrogenase
MGLMRAALLAGSESAWLREKAMRRPSVRRAVSRFMPGETVDDALRAAGELRGLGIGAVITRLGENIRDAGEASEVARHYLGGLERASALGRVELSVKPTQLGLDVDRDLCAAALRSLAERAKALGTYVWIDMEQSRYVDATLDLGLGVRDAGPHVGVCVQAYLRRTPEDVERLVAGGVGIRLVKGAYREPPAVALPARREVDARYLALARRLLAPDARAGGVRAVFGTHDPRLLRAIPDHAEGEGLAPGACEFHLLYGIQRAEQRRLARAGHRVSVLVSYGSHWFPWYMRRLAERPANVLFVVKSVFRA